MNFCCFNRIYFQFSFDPNGSLTSWRQYALADQFQVTFQSSSPNAITFYMSETFPAFESNLLHLGELHYPIYSCCIFAATCSKKWFHSLLSSAAQLLHYRIYAFLIISTVFRLTFFSCCLGRTSHFTAFVSIFCILIKKLFIFTIFIVCKLHMSRYCLIKIFMFNPFHSYSMFP